MRLSSFSRSPQSLSRRLYDSINPIFAPPCVHLADFEFPRAFAPQSRRASFRPPSGSLRPVELGSLDGFRPHFPHSIRVPPEMPAPGGKSAGRTCRTTTSGGPAAARLLCFPGGCGRMSEKEKGDEDVTDHPASPLPERGSCTGEASTGWAGFCTGCCAA